MFLVIGTTTLDLIVRGAPRTTRLGDGFRSDNLVFCDKPLLMLLGGNGGISACGLARLEVPTALCSSIGRDDFGDWLAAKLQRHQVDLSGLLRQPGLATSSSTILLDDAENQTVFHHKGATSALEFAPIHEKLCWQAEVLLASSYPLFPKMRREGFKAALSTTRARGGVTALDIGPAIDEAVTVAELSPLFFMIDYLIGNAHELMSCTGCMDWQSAAATLLDRGCPKVLIKRGAEGSSLRSSDSSIDLPAFPVAAQLSVGAGDLFNAGFLYSIWRGRSESEAMRFGSALAALTIRQETGVLNSPSAEQVEEFLDNSARRSQ